MAAPCLEATICRCYISIKLLTLIYFLSYCKIICYFESQSTFLLVDELYEYIA